jgi:hypothetical protein
MTAVPSVTFGPNGVIIPSTQAVLQGVIADFQAAFNNTLNLSLSNPSSLATPQGQLATSMAAAINAANQTFLLQSTQTDPAYAFGRWQDAIARIYFIYRIGSQPTVLQIVCNGSATPIPIGSTIQDEDGNIYTATAAGTLPVGGGSITLPFANNIPGPIAVPATNAVTIYLAIPGWDSVSVASGVLGSNTESRSAFETRRAATVAGNSFGAIGSIIGAVAKVPGVTDHWGYDNDKSTATTIMGVTVAPNSIYIAVAGGAPIDVAQAILSKKSPGSPYTGNTTVTAYDNNPLYSAPVPYEVTFEIPAPLQILFVVNITNGALVPSNATALIQAAIINAFAGADGGPRARIGSTIYASRFYAAVAALGAWASIIDIFIGSNNNAAAASFTGSISGTNLSVSAVASGSLAIGQTISDATGNIAVGTRILSGSGASWTVSVAQAVSSEAMQACVANQNTVVVNANQLPEISGNNILVNLV